LGIQERQSGIDFILIRFIEALFSLDLTLMSKVVNENCDWTEKVLPTSGEDEMYFIRFICACLVLVDVFVSLWEDQVSNKRYRRSKVILDILRKGVLRDFIGLANCVNRFSHISLLWDRRSLWRSPRKSPSVQASPFDDTIFEHFHTLSERSLWSEQTSSTFQN
jgi:hypothetical protein